MNLRRLFLAGFAALFLALSGCAGSLRVPGETGEVAELLEYFHRLGTMPADEQRREYNAAQAAFEKQPGDSQRLRLSLVLLLPRTAWHDDARALQLLGGMEPATAGRASPRRELALLLQKLVGEKQRLLRDEHNKAEDLQQKIDALRAIDRESRRRPPGY